MITWAGPLTLLAGKSALGAETYPLPRYSTFRYSRNLRRGPGKRYETGLVPKETSIDCRQATMRCRRRSCVLYPRLDAFKGSVYKQPRAARAANSERDEGLVPVVHVSSRCGGAYPREAKQRVHHSWGRASIRPASRDGAADLTWAVNLGRPTDL